MKKKLTILSLLLVLTLVFATACKKDDPTVDPTATPKATEQSTAAPTTEPQPTEVPGPTMRPISEEEKGKPQKDAEVLIQEDFEDGQISDTEFFIKYPENLDIADGIMSITRDWSAVSPEYGYGLGSEHNQYEFSTKFRISHLQGDAPHVAYWIGARAPEVERTADYPGGFWLAFNYSKSICVYPGGDNFPDVESWALKYFTITAPESFDTEHTVTVVDTGDAVYYYMNTAEEEYYLLLKAVFDGSDLLVYDHNGTEIWGGENAVNEDPQFSIFSHRSKTHTDIITLKGY